MLAAAPKATDPNSLTVRFLPEFVNSICASVLNARESGAWPGHPGGLLFGTRNRSTITIQSFRRIVLSSPKNDVEARYQQLQHHVERLSSAASTEPELSGLKVIGWCSVHRNSSAGLLERALQFHAQHFPGAIGLLLTPDAERHGVLAHLLTPDARGAPSTHTRSVQLQPDTIVTYPVEMNIDLGSSREDSLSQLAIPNTETVPLSHVPPAQSPTPKGLLWAVSVACFVLAVAISVAWVYTRTQPLALASTASPSAKAAPNPRLRMRIQPGGEAVVLSWDRDAAALSHAKNAVLQIDDGPVHQTVYLDPSEIANGSIVYRPVSKDARFRLQIVGDGRSTISDSTRMIDGLRFADENVEQRLEYVPPRPVKQTLPNTNAFSFSDVRQGTEVKVRVRIDVEGHVVDARILDGVEDSPAIRKASLAAARQWLFQPAKSGGKSVQSDHVIAFRFHS